MKKIFSIIIATAIITTACISVQATTISEEGGESSASVKGTYVPGKTSSTVYSVDVAWGNMEFTYTDKYVGDWNPETHSYVNSVPAKWSCNTNSNKISVTNHSNTEINSTVSYESKSNFSEITGSFSKNSLNLGTAVNTTVSNAPSDSTFLSLSGELNKSTTSNTVVGMVTVSISK